MEKTQEIVPQILKQVVNLSCWTKETNHQANPINILLVKKNIFFGGFRWLLLLFVTCILICLLYNTDRPSEDLVVLLKPFVQMEVDNVRTYILNIAVESFNLSPFLFWRLRDSNPDLYHEPGTSLTRYQLSCPDWIS